MRQYLTAKEYLDLTNELRQMVDNKTTPIKTFELAFATGYDGHLQGLGFLKIYSSYLTVNPQADLKDLHSLCLGYGTAGSVLDAVIEEDKDPNKQYH